MNIRKYSRADLEMVRCLYLKEIPFCKNPSVNDVLVIMLCHNLY